MTTPSSFVLTRVFKAPCDLVWRAFTNEDQIKGWLSPQGFTLPHSRMDLNVGGTFHYCMKGLIGPEMWGKWTFRVIEAPLKLEVVQSFSDAQGGITRHPMAPTWPLQTLSVTTFAEQGNDTLLTLGWMPYEATDLEIATFAASHESMRIGWGGTFDQLDAHLAAQVAQA
ncbi:MAG: hypothetical protein RL459_134 [Pseudomonadota bacterium]|jgi:uncharacterized protein YndB with AHSA1/START domain